MAALHSILVVDDEPAIRHVLTLVLTAQGYDVRAVSDGAEALKELAARPYDVLISDVRMPNVDGMTLLKAALATYPELTVLVMSAYGSKEQALEAVSAGAYDFLQKPFKPEEVVFLLKKAAERQRLLNENRRLRAGSPDSNSFDRMVSASPGMQALKKQLQRVAPVSTTVLISGESGTGKELVARALHELSNRASMSFVTVNCGAIPAGLIESELFGHAKGAFTDAKSAKRGLFSEADGGTIFLDEIGELPAAAQVKLLRVLQEGEVRAVGENRIEKVDVRVVAATLRDLARLVQQGLFREDLFFRLNVMNLVVPSLKNRREDIIPLADEFLGRFNRHLNRDPRIEGISARAAEALVSYDWPGNVRELEHAMERAVLLADGTHIEVEDLPDKVWAAPARPAPVSSPQVETGSLSLKKGIAELEERLIRAALRKTRGNRTRAAEVLEISHRALLYKLKDYGIDADAEGAKEN